MPRGLFSSFGDGGGCSLVAMLRLLIVVASLVEHGQEDTWASVVVVQGLSCSTTGLFLD